MIYNLLLYMGIFFIVAGFSLWLYSEHKLREIDIQLFKLEQRIKKELSSVKNWCSCYLCFLYYLNDLFWSIGMGNDTMTITEMEKEIIKAIRIESRIPLISDVGYKNLIKFVRKLFKEYRSEWIKIVSRPKLSSISY